MRYGLALLIAGVVIAALAVFSWWNYNAIERSVRQHMRQQQERGELPPELQGVDIEALALNNFKVQVQTDEINRQDIARFLAVAWYLWAPLVVGVCVGVVALVSRWRGRPRKGT
jgi:4-amino-4-deoxy-L-arabinose transferase-like glycosyltransferase